MLRLAAHSSRREQSAAFHAWARAAAAGGTALVHRAGPRCRPCSRGLRGRSLGGAFCAWRAAAALGRHARELPATRLPLCLARAGESRACQAWAAWTGARRRRAALLRRAAGRLRFAAQARVVSHWRGVVQRRGRRAVALRRLANAALARAWRAWLAALGRAERAAQAAGLAAAQAEAGRLAGAAARARELTLRGSLLAWQLPCLARAWATWAAACRARRARRARRAKLAS